MDRWRATLDEFLEQPEAGLGHAQVRVDIAYWLMKSGKWREAEPYAAAAAETWAAWAMRCATECYAGLEDWDRSESWVRRTSERYPANALDWFFWCRRTGHGDMEAAPRVAEAFGADLGEPIPARYVREAASFHVLMGRPEEARKVFYPRHFAANDRVDDFHLLLLLVGPGDASMRGSVARHVVEVSPELAPIADVFTAAGDGRREREAAERFRSRQQDPAFRKELAYILGRQLQHLGRPDHARPLLEEAAGSLDTYHLTRALAAVALREPRRPDAAPGPDKKSD